MRTNFLLLIASIFFLAYFSNCKSDTTNTQPATEPISVGTPVAPPAPAAPNPADAPAQNSIGIWHYTCLNGCPNGAGSAVACATCGTLLVHNAIYHNDANQASNPPPIGGQPPIPPGIQTPPPNAVPAQNAAGVWHYTCPGGCAGGAGAAVACATCSKLLQHNQAYHL